MTAERWIRFVIAMLALAQIGLGLWEAFAPGSFSDTIGGFGSPNAHYVRDVATFTLALGIALLIAVGRHHWRVPVLFVGTVGTALHLANHVRDIGNGQPSWAGPLDVVLLSVQAIAFLVAMVASARHRA
jgi:hypothetical protein